MENNTVPVIPEQGPITDELLEKMNAYWRAANYLSACQLYLLENPLLKKPLTREMVKKKIKISVYVKKLLKILQSI